MKVLDQFGELLRAARKCRGLTIRDVERELGLSNSFIAQIENGKRNISFENAILLASFYDIDLKLLSILYTRRILNQREDKT